jgi:hypothetical protein
VVDCNPCLSGLSCPPDRSFDVLIEEPRDFLQVDLLGRGGERIARARALEEPVTQGDRTFRQMLSFKAEKGVQYRLEIRPGRASEEFAEKMGETMPLNFALRTEKGLVSPERRRFDFLNRGQLDIRRDLRGLRVKPEFDQ